MQRFQTWRGFPPRTHEIDVPKANSGRHDPRLFRGPGFTPDMQPDEAQFRRWIEGYNAGALNFNDVLRLLNAENIPPQLNQTLFTIVGTGSFLDKPQLLIPQNPNRMSFAVSNPFTAPMFITYGSSAQNTGLSVGIIVPPGTTYQEQNGSVSIDDIFVQCGFFVAGGQLACTGYEGTLAIGGHWNQRKTERQYGASVDGGGLAR